MAARAPAVATEPAQPGSALSLAFTSMTLLVHGHPSFPEDNAVY